MKGCIITWADRPVHMPGSSISARGSLAEVDLILQDRGGHGSQYFAGVPSILCVTWT